MVEDHDWRDRRIPQSAGALPDLEAECSSWRRRPLFSHDGSATWPYASCSDTPALPILDFTGTNCQWGHRERWTKAGGWEAPRGGFDGQDTSRPSVGRRARRAPILFVIRADALRRSPRALIAAAPPTSLSSSSIRPICSSICTISARDRSIISRLVAICAKVSSRPALRNLRCCLNPSTVLSSHGLATAHPFKSKSG